jgi:hypothetical protein
MKTTITFCLAILLSSCSSDDIEPSYKVDTIAQKHVTQFLKEADARGVKVSLPISFSLSFVDRLGDDHPGECVHTFKSNKFAEITISNTNKNWPYKSLEMIIFHELGHCILKRSHSAFNTSIMYEKMDGSLQRYYDYREEMIDELFQINK